MEHCKICTLVEEILVASRGGKVTVSVTFDNTCGHAHAAQSDKETQEPCYERFSGFATLRVNTDGKR